LYASGSTFAVYTRSVSNYRVIDINSNTNAAIREPYKQYGLHIHSFGVCFERLKTIVRRRSNVTRDEQKETVRLKRRCRSLRVRPPPIDGFGGAARIFFSPTHTVVRV